MSLKLNRNTETAVQDDSWKSYSFLNISLPTNDGGKHKIGFIGFKSDNADHAQIIEALANEATRAEVLEQIASLLIFDYRLANDPNRSTLKLA